MNDQYTPNRHLARLAEELETLNRSLIAAKLPDQARIDCMREYAKVSRRLKEYEKEFNTETKLPTGVRETPSGRFNVRINSKGKHRCIGTYDSVEEAAEAYITAHIELFGVESRYYQEMSEVV